MNGTTLYEIAVQYQELSELVDREEVTAEEVVDTFEAIVDAAGVKIDAICEIYRNKIGASEMIDAEIKRLRELKTRQMKAAERLEGLVYTYLTITGKRRENGEKFSVSLRKNPPSVNITDESAIPQEYIREKVTTSIDKTAIKNALKSGETVAGAELVQSERAVLS